MSTENSHEQRLPTQIRCQYVVSEVTNMPRSQNSIRKRNFLNAKEIFLEYLDAYLDDPAVAFN
jgi:hypothetical protein